jgi:LemA protein
MEQSASVMWLVAVALGLLAAGVYLYNALVRARNLTRQGLADIDVQLKRRADLVPQVVEAVRGYAAYERALLAAVTELRGKALHAAGTARFDFEKQLGARLQQLVLLQEAYPELKADANFRDLAAKLVEVEDALQHARRFYNGAVKQYLTRLQSFPDVLVARLFGFEPMPFFQTEDRAPARVVL